MNNFSAHGSHKSGVLALRIYENDINIRGKHQIDDFIFARKRLA